MTSAYEASYSFSSASARRATLQWLWHSLGLALFGVFLLFCFSLYGTIAARSDREVLAFCAGAAFCFLAIYTWAVLRPRSLPELGRVSLRLTDDGLAMSSNHFESLTRWSAVRRITETRDFVFILRRGGSILTVPRAALSAEGVVFLRQKGPAAAPPAEV